MRWNLILSAIITQENFDVNLKKNFFLLKKTGKSKCRLMSKFITNLLVCLWYISQNKIAIFSFTYYIAEVDISVFPFLTWTILFGTLKTPNPSIPEVCCPTLQNRNWRTSQTKKIVQVILHFWECVKNKIKLK